MAFDSARPPLNDPPGHQSISSGSLGRQLPRTAAPEGWVKRIDRRRVGKVWVGFFHLWTTDANGRRVRQQKEKTLGPASMPKHEAQQKLADYIEEYTGRLTKQGSSIATFNDLWKAFCAVKSGQWSKKTKRRSAVPFRRNTFFRSSATNRRGKSRLHRCSCCSTNWLTMATRNPRSEEFAPTSRLALSTPWTRISSQKNPARKLAMPNDSKEAMRTLSEP